MSLTIHLRGLAILASLLSVALPPSAAISAEAPAATETYLDVPLGTFTLGPDKDSDGLPAWIEFPTDRLSIRSDGYVRWAGQGAPYVLPIDPNDKEYIAPRQSVQFDAPTGGIEFGPDKDGDNIPATIQITNERWTFETPNRMERRAISSTTSFLDPDDKTPHNVMVNSVNAGPRGCGFVRQTCLEARADARVIGTPVAFDGQTDIHYTVFFDDGYLVVDSGIGGRFNNIRVQRHTAQDIPILV